MSQSAPAEPDFPSLPRLSCRVSPNTTVARVKALWESLVGKPSGKVTDPYTRDRKPDTAAQLGMNAEVHVLTRDED